MDDPGKVNSKPAKRLCNEIKLFDLCERESCAHREGRFCTDQDMLDRFERIAEDDRPTEHYLEDEQDGEEGDDESGYGDAFGDDEYDDEGDDREDE
jgi:hypothetical protein